MESVAARVERFCSKQLELLALEREAEVAEQQLFLTKYTRQQLQQRGVALYSLSVVGTRTGFAGKTIAEFVNPNQKTLPAHEIRVGDVVQVGRPGDRRSCGKKDEPADAPCGIVSCVREGSIEVAFKDGLPMEASDGLRILKLANETSFRRMREVIGRLAEAGKHPTGLIRFLFDKSPVLGGHMRLPPSEAEPQQLPESGWYNCSLNGPQKSAVARSLAFTNNVHLIHGPPGTGKTETVVEVIRQLAKPKLFPHSRPRRVLVCGPSNLSVDNIVERLARGRRPGIEMVRIGHPARMLESVVPYSLDSVLANGDAAALVADIRAEMDRALRRLAKAPRERREIYAELRALRKELRERERGAIETLLNGNLIVLSTLNMAGSKMLRDRKFDVAVIDEAGQALSAECWIAMLSAENVILAGDHCQLPPTIVSDEAKARGLGITLFERLMKRDLLGTTSMLTIQYRMNETIMGWSSNEFYGGKLVADARVANHRLGDGIDAVGKGHRSSGGAPWVFVDTAGYNMWEAQVDDYDSKYNEGEADLAIAEAEDLVSNGVEPSAIAIIAPYSAQVALLEGLVAKRQHLLGLEVGTVDGFQGREKEAVIISMVRSNEGGEVGFLSEVRRTNVAITRARRYVCIIGDSSTLEKHKFYARLV